MNATTLALGSLLLAMSLAANTAHAACGCGDTADDGCYPKTCVYTPEKGTEERHGWCVECKEVCIPEVRCPWEPGGSKLTCFSWLKCFKKAPADCCDTCCDPCSCSDSGGCGTDACCCAKPHCGRVLCVRDLKKEKYEVEVCKWKAEIRRLPPCCCERCQGTAGCCECVACSE